MTRIPARQVRVGDRMVVEGRAMQVTDRLPGHSNGRYSVVLWLADPDTGVSVRLAADSRIPVEVQR